MIIVTHKTRPLPRAGKNTILRKAALKEYHNEIENLLVSFSFFLVKYRVLELTFY